MKNFNPQLKNAFLKFLECLENQIDEVNQHSFYYNINYDLMFSLWDFEKGIPTLGENIVFFAHFYLKNVIEQDKIEVDIQEQMFFVSHFFASVYYQIMVIIGHNDSSVLKENIIEDYRDRYFEELIYKLYIKTCRNSAILILLSDEFHTRETANVLHNQMTFCITSQKMKSDDFDIYYFYKWAICKENEYILRKLNHVVSQSLQDLYMNQYQSLIIPLAQGFWAMIYKTILKHVELAQNKKDEDGISFLAMFTPPVYVMRSCERFYIKNKSEDFLQFAEAEYQICQSLEKCGRNKELVERVLEYRYMAPKCRISNYLFISDIAKKYRYLKT